MFRPNLYAAVLIVAAILTPATQHADTLVVGAQADTFIRDDNPQNNYSLDWALITGNTAASAAELNVLVRFPLTNALLTHAAIDSATLELVKRVSGNSAAGASTIRVYETIPAWNVTHATWVNAATATPWQTGGAEGAGTDYVNTLLASFTGNEAALPVPSTLTFTSETALRAAVQGNLAGTLDLLLIVPNDPVNRRVWNLASVDDPYHAAPKLTIQYTPPAAGTVMILR